MVAGGKVMCLTQTWHCWGKVGSGSFWKPGLQPGSPCLPGLCELPSIFLVKSCLGFNPSESESLVALSKAP